ncbi:hypothetical protein HHI36_006972, partial [Cryptolaemus montrouzieri]
KSKQQVPENPNNKIQKIQVTSSEKFKQQVTENLSNNSRKSKQQIPTNGEDVSFP